VEGVVQRVGIWVRSARSESVSVGEWVNAKFRGFGAILLVEWAL